jgi:hypothetical protein
MPTGPTNLHQSFHDVDGSSDADTIDVYLEKNFVAPIWIESRSRRSTMASIRANEHVLDAGCGVGMAAPGGRCIHYTKKLLPLAYLAPDLVEMILEGRQPPALTLSALTADPLPLQWEAQRALIERLA